MRSLTSAQVYLTDQEYVTQSSRRMGTRSAPLRKARI
jgi:hypothetical protein